MGKCQTPYEKVIDDYPSCCSQEYTEEVIFFPRMPYWSGSGFLQVVEIDDFEITTQRQKRIARSMLVISNNLLKQILLCVPCRRNVV